MFYEKFAAIIKYIFKTERQEMKIPHKGTDRLLSAVNEKDDSEEKKER